MIADDSPGMLATKISQLINKRGGFFIEAGANNGVWQSNTLYLETELGWSGLLIEPNKKKFEECKKYRNAQGNIFYNCALVNFGYEKGSIDGYFNEVDYENSLMAQACENNPRFSEDDPRWHNKKKVNVEARRLSDILDENDINEIDFFSLDVEGCELNALNGIDFSRHAPRAFCIEISKKSGIQNFLEIKQLLESNGYIMKARITEQDYIFEKISSHSDSGIICEF